jgi:hypothetical protein
MVLAGTPLTVFYASRFWRRAVDCRQARAGFVLSMVEGMALGIILILLCI